MAPTSLSLIADITDTTVSQLAEWNPAVLRGLAPEHYAVHVPKGAGAQLIAALQLVPAIHSDTWRMHTVAPGETLAAIGKKYSVVPASIVTANNLKGAEPREGDRLLIPMAARPTVPARTAVHSAVVRHTSPATTTSHTVAHTAVHRTPAATTKAPAKKNTASANPPRKSSVLVARVSKQ